MFSPDQDSIHKAPADEDGISACRKTNCGIKKAAVHLGRSLPSLLDEGCEFKSPLSSTFIRPLIQKNASPATINHYSNGQWQSLSLPALRRAAEEIALALQHNLSLTPGQAPDRLQPNGLQDHLYPRAALLMASDTAFVMADIGCLLAQLVTVPMSPEQPLETSAYVLQETEASVLFVSKLRQVEQLLPIIPQLKSLRLIVVDSTPKAPSKARLDKIQRDLPTAIEMVTLETLRSRAAWSEAKASALHAALDPKDIATIVYTLTASGKPLGAMLTHENLSGSALAAFSTLPCLRRGPEEIALSFLPLHHIFARGFVYGSLCYGQSLYFSNPRLVMKHLQALKPTVFYSVPRLLEKVYEGWQDAPNKLNGRFRKPQRMVMAWAWDLAERYQLEEAQSPWYRLQLWAARQSVLRPLRNLFGGRLQCFIVGGAALPAEVMTVLSAAGLELCQGYGLTEAASTLSFTRRQWSRVGTVGVPMPGVELALAPDGEVMVKAPYVMQGYYRHPEETRAVLEPNGWLHTGDRGEFSADGLLTLKGCKKEMFKLSIGEYVAPAPIEKSLRESPLVAQALVVGPGRKFCGALIFLTKKTLAMQARQMGLSTPPELLAKQPQVVATYQLLIDKVNATVPIWSTIKRFELVDAERIGKDTQLATSRTLNRKALYLAFAEEVDRLYQPPRSKVVLKKATRRSRKWPILWSTAQWRPKKAGLNREQSSVAESL